LETPNMSARMDNLRAALLRPQLAQIETACDRWNALHDRIADTLGTAPGFEMPHRPAAERYVASSLQFRLPGVGATGAPHFLDKMAARGVELKWFGRADPVGFTSAHQSWAYVAPQPLPRTDAILSDLFDMRLPLTFSLEDCDLIAAHLMDVAAEMTEPA
ncbi:MAG: DegT/DnrJ/EryC1/StrS family aminotransferase, partial [Pseudomonadota bacterium]